jgi:hypothetical protein
MTAKINLEDLVRRYVVLPPTPTGTGWFPILCQVCHDHGSKGSRAAFRFDDGGHSLGYNCFNCGHTASFGEDQKEAVHPDLEVMFNAYHVPDAEWGGLHLQVLGNQSGGMVVDSSSQPIQRESIEAPILQLPSHFYSLESADPEQDQWAYIARDYLEHDRGVDPDSYPFYLSTGVTELPHEKYTVKKWLGRVIIPIYNRHNELIYYQGRSLVDMTKKYESPSDSKNKVLYGFDEVYRRSDLPLYILEGFFDAYMIGGCATMGNKLREAQIEHLSRSPRKKVLIPDRFGDGHIQAKQALELGWSVSIPDIPGCKDINEAVRRYGKMYVMKSIADRTASGFIAEVNLELYCDDTKQTKGRSKN